MNRIRPELLADKLHAISSLEERKPAEQLLQRPRLVETLWFLQAMSMLPGGLDAFVLTLIRRYPNRFATQAMMEAGKPTNGGRYSEAQCLKIWQCERQRTEVVHLCGGGWQRLSLLAKGKRSPASFEEWTELTMSPDDYFNGLWNEIYHSKPVVRSKEVVEREMKRGLDEFNLDFLQKKCVGEATRDLAAFLCSMCVDMRTGFEAPGYCVELFPMLEEAMEQHRKQQIGAIAETEVTRIVFDRLEFAAESKVPVPIVGLSRFGKTTAVATWCESRPGLARMVTVPESNRDRDFFAAHADAFGIEYTVNTSNARLVDNVEFVHKHFGGIVVYDEAHHLIPTSYTKTTAPRRLNWVRGHVIDRGLGCAFFATPQSYRQTLADFAKKTGWNFDQWLGRLAPAAVLPEELSQQDLMAVARLHFPDFQEPYLKLIVGHAMTSEGFLKNIEHVCKRARYLAAKRGAARIAMPDVEQALVDMIPGTEETSIRSGVNDQDGPVPARRRASAPPLQRPCTSAAPAPQLACGGAHSEQNRFFPLPHPSVSVRTSTLVPFVPPSRADDLVKA